MSTIYQTLVNTRKFLFIAKSVNATITKCKCPDSRAYSDSAKKYVTFEQAVEHRRTQARRSLVVQVNSDLSFGELYSYCSNHGTVSGIHHYTNSGGEHFMLVEFDRETDIAKVFKSGSSHRQEVDVMALQTPFLWFRAVNGKKEKAQPPENVILQSKNGCANVNEDVLCQEMQSCHSISEQIQMLYDRTALNDLGVRLRYMVARQIEVVFKSLYANIAVRPFGSSVNGFGKMGCDLDLVLTNTLTDEMSSNDHRLVYQEKKCENSRWQRHMELVGELLELRVPGAAHVRRILHARVPIVKYRHELANVECDLCYSNMSGVYMSELLYLYGSMDSRVRPLAFTIRRWAQTVGLTNPNPGRWITNFPLTLMVLFFLQQKTKDGAILPPLKFLVKKAEKEDIRITEEKVNCTFLRDLNRLPSGAYGQSTESLQSLLLQFFEFYAQFDFQEKAISINEGIPLRKTNNTPLYIINPLEQGLNVSRNVSYEECERLKTEVRNAAWQLETALEGEKTDDWGLVGLIEKRNSALKSLIRVGNSHRLITVSDLFKDDSETTIKHVTEENVLRNKIERITSKEVEKTNLLDKKSTELRNKLDKPESEKNVKDNSKIKFKNSDVENLVRRIRRNKIL